MTPLELWYRAPAQEWTDALPLGNGRLGAMMFGGVEREELQLNESTLWSGGPYQPTNKEALPHLAEVRALIFAGKYAEAEALANKHLMAKPYLQMSYQPAGNLYLDFDHKAEPGSYRRSLDLDTAVTSVSYVSGGVRHTREAFSSAADGILALRLSADTPGSVSFSMSLFSEQKGSAVPSEDGIVFTGSNSAEHGVPGRLKFTIRSVVRLKGGKRQVVDGRLVVTGADEAMVLIDVATSFRRFDNVSGDAAGVATMRLLAVTGRTFEALRQVHVAEHQRLFHRMSLDLGSTPQAALPTDERVEKFASGDDPALAALYVQFGRYLMIASSRPGTQPSTLQGIWNKETRPPWGSKYTANINLQMNYWLPDPANLSECVEPLIAMAEELTVTGAEMAKVHYGAGGWVMHHNTDLWRATGPVDGARWGVWPTGGAWLSAQLWDHAVFAGRPKKLVERLYPILKGATRFILDILVPLPGTLHLVTSPSLSPENVHPGNSSLCAGPTMDNQILRDLFDAFIAASGQLEQDKTLAQEVAAAKARLPPHKIGKAGQLQEWLEDWDMDVPEIDHRHVSHLYGLYPSHQIGVDSTPELAAAARQSLEIRGDEATGWGIGWRLNLWARLRDGEHAHAVLAMLLSPDRTYRNLFDAHPPFQIDGNFGGAAGILEMLVQSRGNEMWLLPAVPAHWHTGKISGLRVRGGYTLDLEWRAGKVTTARLTSTQAGRLSVFANGEMRAIKVAGAETRVLTY